MKRISILVICSLTIAGLSGCAGTQEIRVNGVRLEEDERESAGPEAETFLSESGLDTYENSSGADPEETIAVYVCGAVQDPAVYHFPADARVCDAIEAAGGFSQDADTRWLNLAQHLQDAQMLTVYTCQETAQMKEQGIRSGADSSDGGTSGSDRAEGQDLVDLNTATREQLMTLPGIGESKADAILRYREENGPFSCTEDVMNISGIKNSVYARIREQITVH